MLISWMSLNPSDLDRTIKSMYYILEIYIEESISQKFFLKSNVIAGMTINAPSIAFQSNFLFHLLVSCIVIL